jgi:hypothetical protein
MIPEQSHWRIMRIIAGATFEGSGKGLTCEAVAGYIGESEQTTRHLLRELVSQEFDEFGCCLAQFNGEFHLAGVRAQEGSEVSESTGAWAALDAAAKNPYIEERSAQAWKDEALTGITTKGERSPIKRASLPKKSGGEYRGTPEDRANRSNMRFLGISKEETDA